LAGRFISSLDERALPARETSGRTSNAIGGSVSLNQSQRLGSSSVWGSDFQTQKQPQACFRACGVLFYECALTAYRRSSALRGGTGVPPVNHAQARRRPETVTRMFLMWPQLNLMRTSKRFRL